jgi:hypothetical protein
MRLFKHCNNIIISIKRKPVKAYMEYAILFSYTLYLFFHEILFNGQTVLMVMRYTQYSVHELLFETSLVLKIIRSIKYTVVEFSYEHRVYYGFITFISQFIQFRNPPLYQHARRKEILPFTMSHKPIHNNIIITGYQLHNVFLDEINANPYHCYYHYLHPVSTCL